MKQGLNEIISLMQRMGVSILTEEVLMEATRDEIYDVYYHEKNGKVKKIPRDKFDKFCEIGDVDNNPNKMSEFAKWLCDIYRTAKYDSFYVFTYDKLKEDFLTFRKLQRIKPQGIDLNLRNYTLDSFTYAMYQARKDGLDMSQKDIKRNGTEVFFKNKEWEILWLKTYEASKFYGRGTRWCTASNEDSEHFNIYNNRGILICFINLINGEKYQIHVRSSRTVNDGISDQMNAEDYPINIRTIVPEDILKLILDKAHKRLEIIENERWVNNAEVIGKITPNVELLTIKDNNTYRLFDKSKNEYVIINGIKTYVDFQMYPEWGIVNMTEVFGERSIILLINGNSFSVLADNVTTFYEIDESYLDDEKENNTEELFLLKKKGYETIFNAKTRSFFKIGGIEKFATISYDSRVILIKTLDNEFMIYNRRIGEIVRIKGHERFKNLTNLGSYLFNIETKGGDKFVYSLEHGLIVDSPYIDNIVSKKGEYIIWFHEGDEHNFKLYSPKTNTFISANGIDVFQGYETVAYGTLLILYVYEPKLQVFAYNTEEFEISESSIIPMQESEVEGIYNENIIFWGDDDILYRFDVSKNMTFKLPVEIKKDEVIKDESQHEKYTQIFKLVTEKAEYILFLMVGRPMLLVKKDNGERETYDL